MVRPHIASGGFALPESRTVGLVKERLIELLRTGRARIAVIGLGYAGLPLAVEFAKRFPTVGIDIDPGRVSTVRSGRSPIRDVSSEVVAHLVGSGKLRAETGFEALADSDCVIICVPTPLLKGKRPDTSHILAAAQAIATHLHRDQLIVLESTTYPGTTDEKLLPLFLQTGLRLDEDFFLAFSPERIDPGNPDHHVYDIPKLVGGCTPPSTEVAAELYGNVTPVVHRVGSARVAEAAKLWENTFRLVNIALVNEMAILCHRLGIESSEVIEAAKTKPFGFMPFYPGPGVGGHCIPLDPLYLSWKAGEHGYNTGLLLMSEQINSAMPDYVVQLISDALGDHAPGRPLRGARILVLGVAYKEQVEDVRRSPALTIMERLHGKGALLRYHDPLVRRMEFPAEDTARDPGLDLPPALESVELTDEEVSSADCVVVVTAHRGVDYERVGRQARIIVDTRNAIPRSARARVVRI